MSDSDVKSVYAKMCQGLEDESTATRASVASAVSAERHASFTTDDDSSDEDHVCGACGLQGTANMQCDDGLQNEGALRICNERMAEGQTEASNLASAILVTK